MTRKGNSRLKFLIILLIPVSLFVVLILPVILFLRISVFCFFRLNLNEWISLIIGMVITFAFLFWYISWIYRKWTNRKKLNPKARGRNLKIAGGVILFYCLYGLLYISGVNAKSTEIREQYSTLHPLLRIAVGTLLLFDRSLVVTDLARTQAEYDKMGLEKKKKSLHFLQSDGYVHAVDLRTNGRSEWKNSLVKLYFGFLGFNTLRHVGTADHLHVSISAKDNKNGI